MSIESIQTMSKPRQPIHRRPTRPLKPPPLHAGDRLSRAEFEWRYQAHPEIKKAELIEGVVYMPTPFSCGQPRQPHFNVITWLGVYFAATPGLLAGGANDTVRLHL